MSHHDIALLHPQPMSLPSINSLHLTVSEIQPGQTFFHSLPACLSERRPTHPDIMGENNTPTAHKGCGIKTGCRKHSGTPKVKGHTKITLYHYSLTTSNQNTWQAAISYTLWFLKYSLNKILKVKVTMASSKVKSRSYQDKAH